MAIDRNEDKYRKQSRTPRRRERSTAAVSYTALSGDSLIRCLETISSANGALRFGKSRDNGAYSLGVYGDGEPYTEWFRDPDELAEFLVDLAKIFQGRKDLQE